MMEPALRVTQGGKGEAGRGMVIEGMGGGGAEGGNALLPSPLRIERPKPVNVPADFMRLIPKRELMPLASNESSFSHCDENSLTDGSQSSPSPSSSRPSSFSSVSPCPSSSSSTSSCSSVPSGAVSSSSPPRRPPPQIGCPDPCAVCGDQSTGYHYDVPSCNGCKTFFRRTLVAQRSFVCKKDGNCFSVLTKEKRCVCRACRFEKCVEVGMNPLAIVSSDDLSSNSVMRSVLARRKRPSNCSESVASSPSDIKPDLAVVRRLVSQEDSVDRLIDGLLYLELKHDAIRKSTFSPRTSMGIQLRDLIEVPSALGKPQEEMPNWPVKGDIFVAIPLSIRVRDRIPLPTPEMVEQLPPHIKQWFFADLVYSIEYVKTFDFFCQLDKEDKQAVLKNSALQCANVTASYFSYEHNSERIIYPDGRIKMEVTDEEQTSNIVPSLIRLNLDRKEYVLLKAVVLCNPSWENLSDRARSLITPEREKYAQSLLAYLLTHRGPANGPAVFSAMMAIVDTLSHQAKRSKDFHTLMCALQLRQKPTLLIDEIFS